MRWEELGAGLPQGALKSHLVNSYTSVEAFLVDRSKLLAAAAVFGGPPQGGVGPHAGLDDGSLAAAEALAASCFAPQWLTGTQIMHELRHSIQVLPTGCSAVDALLGGGLREGTLIEVAGETASGKTQLCLSAAATTALRAEPVLFVDTTASFAPQRVVQLAQAEAEASAVAMGEAWAGDPELPSRVLGCISVVRPANVHELLAILDRLEAALQSQQRQQRQEQGQQGQRGQQGHPQEQGERQGAQRPGPPAGPDGDGAAGGAASADDRAPRAGPRLVVVDSVSALLSTVLGSNQHSQGKALLATAGRMLKQLAERHCLAVMVTNHVTVAGSAAGRGPGGGGGGGRAGGGAGDGAGSGASGAPSEGVAGLKPALGEQWRPQPHMRVQLSVDETQPAGAGARIATLTASPLQALGLRASFRITPTGLH